MAAAHNWVRVFNLLLPILDRPGELTDTLGARFIGEVQEVDPRFPNYEQWMDERKRLQKSAGRKDYFYEVLCDLDDDRRLKLLHRILDDIQPHEPALVRELRAILILDGAVPE